MNNGYTPTEQKLIDVLIDGEPHKKDELLLAIDSDGLVEDSTLRVHIKNIRHKLPTRDRIVNVSGGPAGNYYQMVRMLDCDSI